STLSLHDALPICPRSLRPGAGSRPRRARRRHAWRGSAPPASRAASHTLEHVGPLLEHLGIPVPHGEADMIESGSRELAELLAQLGPGAGERRRANQLRGADLLLLGTEKHEVAAMVAEIAGVSRLVLQIDLSIALDEGRQLRRNRSSQIAELVALDQAVQRDGGGWPRVGPRARAVAGLALAEDAAGDGRGRRHRRRIAAGVAPGGLHVGDRGPGVSRG